MDATEIKQWLGTIGLNYDQYWTGFNSVGFDRWDILFEVSEESFVKYANVKLGHATRMYHLLQQKKIGHQKITKEENTETQAIIIAAKLQKSIIHSREQFIKKLGQNVSHFLSSLPKENGIACNPTSIGSVMDLFAENESMVDNVSQAWKAISDTIIADLDDFRLKLLEIKDENKLIFVEYKNSTNENMKLEEKNKEEPENEQENQPQLQVKLPPLNENKEKSESREKYQNDMHAIQDSNFLKLPSLKKKKKSSDKNGKRQHKKKHKKSRKKKKKTPHPYTQDQNDYLYSFVNKEDVMLSSSVKRIRKDYNSSYNENRSISAITNRLQIMRAQGRIIVKKAARMHFTKQQIQFMSDFINKCGGAHGNLTAENIIELSKLLNDKYGGDRSPLQIVYKLYKCGLILSKTLQLVIGYSNKNESDVFTEEQVEWLREFIYSSEEHKLITMKFNHHFDDIKNIRLISRQLSKMETNDRLRTQDRFTEIANEAVKYGSDDEKEFETDSGSDSEYVGSSVNSECSGSAYEANVAVRKITHPIFPNAEPVVNHLRMGLNPFSSQNLVINPLTGDIIPPAIVNLVGQNAESIAGKLLVVRTREQLVNRRIADGQSNGNSNGNGSGVHEIANTNGNSLAIDGKSDEQSIHDCNPSISNNVHQTGDISDSSSRKKKRKRGRTEIEYDAESIPYIPPPPPSFKQRKIENNVNKL